MEKNENLNKKLNFLDVFSIAAGAMISSGLFVLPGLAFIKAGPAVILCYFIASVLMIPTVLSQLELNTAMPKAGGSYFFIERSLGNLAGVLSGMANWLSISLKSAFALVGIGAFYLLLKPGAPVFEIKLVALSAAALFTVINMVSVELTGKIQVILVGILLALLGWFSFSGLSHINVMNFVPFLPEKGNIFRLLAATSGMVFISFGGLTKVSGISEEVKNPTKTIPAAILSAFFIVSNLYILVVFVIVGIMTPEALSTPPGSLMPLSIAASNIAGKGGLIFMSAAAIIAFITTANAGIMAASRSLFAMSRDKLVPSILEKTSLKKNIPVPAVIMTSLFIILTISFLGLEDLVKTASTLMLLLFVFVNVSVIIMRESHLPSYQPTFKAFLYPWSQIISILVYLFLIFEMGKIPLLITTGFIVMGTLWYYIFLYKKEKRHSALIHIVERITAKELVDNTLTDELNDILIERDNIVEDRFDKIIKNSMIIDMNKLIHCHSFFRTISQKISKRTGLPPDKMYKLLMKREIESSTVIHPGLAIPHIIVPGRDVFDIILIRNKEGIKFPDSDTLVKTVFILLGSKNERNFHLRALMAIAQIAEDPSFNEKWLRAQKLEQLRSIILVAKRTRET